MARPPYPPHVPPRAPYNPHPSSYRPQQQRNTDSFPRPEAYDARDSYRREQPPRESFPQRPAGSAQASSSRQAWRPADSWSPPPTHSPRYQAASSRQPHYEPQYSNLDQRRDFHSSSQASYAARDPSRALPPNGYSAPSTSRQQYIPPHLRTSGRPNDTPFQTDTTSPRASPFSARFSERLSSPTPPPFTVRLPPSKYIALSAEALPSPSDKSKGKYGGEAIPKLLVLDLNGALIYRTARSGASRQSYPRPYLDCFLEYLFAPSKTSPIEGSATKRPWEVFVWSSAQPNNVRGMVEVGFGRKWIEGVWESEPEGQIEERKKSGEGRLLGVWARDKMGLSEQDYHRKTQTTKDLRKVLSHLASPSSNPDPPRPAYTYDERRVVLLDDSPLKAVLQPWNQLVIPEFDKPEWQASKAAASGLTVEGQEGKMDMTLLAVVGILEELRDVANVAAWVRAGGLTPSFDSEGKPKPLKQRPAKEEVALDSLPSHPDFKHWYAIPEVFAYWTERGKAALERKAIVVSPGITSEGHSSNPDRDPHAARQYYQPSHNGSRQGTPPAVQKRSARRWSPSRPAGFSPSPEPASPKGTRGVHTTIDSAEHSEWLLPPPPATVNHSSDKWRTFRAPDVSAYLQDLADRYSPPISSIQRDTLIAAIDVLAAVAIDPDFTAESERMRDWEVRERRQMEWCESGDRRLGGSAAERLRDEAEELQPRHSTRVEVTQNTKAKKMKKGKKGKGQHVASDIDEAKHEIQNPAPRGFAEDAPLTITRRSASPLTSRIRDLAANDLITRLSSSIALANDLHAQLLTTKEGTPSKKVRRQANALSIVATRAASNLEFAQRGHHEGELFGKRLESDLRELGLLIEANKRRLVDGRGTANGADTDEAARTGQENSWRVFVSSSQTLVKRSRTLQAELEAVHGKVNKKQYINLARQVGAARNRLRKLVEPKPGAEAAGIVRQETRRSAGRALTALRGKIEAVEAMLSATHQDKQGGSKKRARPAEEIPAEGREGDADYLRGDDDGKGLRHGYTVQSEGSERSSKRSRRAHPEKREEEDMEAQIVM